MASPLANDVVRRLKDSTDKYKIIELGLLAGDTEALSVSARNPRQDPKEASMPLTDALLQLFPWLSTEEAVDDYTPSEGASGTSCGMQGMIDAKDLEDVLMVCDNIFPLPVRIRLWKVIRALRTTGEVPDMSHVGLSCHVFPLEAGLDITHLEVPLGNFSVVFSSHTEDSVSVSLSKSFGEVLDQKTLGQIAEFSAKAVEVLRHRGVKKVSAGEATAELEKLAHEYDLTNN
jgi:hypothetical protein